MNKWSALLCLVAAAGLPAAELNKSWTVTGPLELRVRSTDAAVEIRGDGSEGGVRAELRTQGWNVGSSDGVQLIDHQNGNSLDLEVRLPRTSFNFGNHSAKLILHVPRSLTLDAKCGDGALAVSSVRGKLLLETSDGSMAARDVDGSLEARTGDGSMQVAGRFDRLQLRVQDGSMNVDVRSGSKLAESWRLQAGDGSVNLRLPGDLSAELEARAGDGSVNIPGARSDGDRHEARRRLGNGGNLLAIKTGDGSINVSGI